LVAGGLGWVAPGADAAVPVQAEYWKGNASNVWGGANWTSDAAGTVPAAPPVAASDVIFSAANATNQSTVLGADFTIHSLTVGDTNAVTINSGAGGSFSLTISGPSGTGIDVRSGAGLVKIGTSVILQADRVNVSNAAGLEINGLQEGFNSGWSKTGTGKLTLRGASVMKGDTGVLGGTLFLQDGGTLSTAQGTVSNAGLTVDGAGSKWTGSGSMVVGFSGGNGVLNIKSGAEVSDTFGGIGLAAIGTVTVDGAGSKWANSATLIVGAMSGPVGTGDGTLNILNGGVVTNTSTFVGSGAATTGKVTVDGAGSSWTMSGFLSVGNGGTGTLKVLNGGKVSNTEGAVGEFNTGTATVNGAGSKWTNSGELYVGRGGAGTLNIENGGEVTDTNGYLGKSTGIGPSGTGEVTVDGAGSKWTNSGAVTIGVQATGQLTIQNGGVVSVGTVLTLGGGSAGTLNLNSGGVLQVGGADGLTTTAVGAAFNFAGGRIQVKGANLTSSLDATLSGTTSTIDTNGFTAAFSGVFSGTGSLTKAGLGTLTLSGVNTYAGATSVDGGVLLVDGSIASPSTTVKAAGTLGGIGTIGGTLINSGVVSPGNGAGTLTVVGPYTQKGSGSLKIEIGGRLAGEHDLLAVGGAASLDGTLQLVRLNHFQLKLGDKIVFLTAKGGVHGTFVQENHTFATGTPISGMVVYEPNQVALSGLQESFAEVAQLIVEQFPKLAAKEPFMRDLTPNQFAVAQALDELVKDGKLPNLVAYLNGRTLPELPGDFEKIAPEELTAIFQTAVALADVQGANLQRRTDDLRSGAGGFSAAGLSINGRSASYSGPISFRTGVAGPTGNEVRDGKDSKSAEVAEAGNRWGAFLSGTGEWVSVGATENARGYDLTTGGFTLGVDYKVTPNFVVGVSAGYAGTAGGLADGGRVWVNGGKLGLYGTYFAGGFYSDVAVSGGYNSYDTKRAALQGTARGSTDGGDLNVLFGTGFDWKIGALKIGPTATFTYTYVGIDGFTEHGSLAPLRIGEQSGESIRTAFGAKASYDWKIGRVLVKPEIRAAWQHEYGDDDYALDCTFANGAGNAFTVHGPQIGRDSLLVGAGFAVQLCETCSTYFYYDGELARKEYDRHSVSGGLRVEF